MPEQTNATANTTEEVEYEYVEVPEGEAAEYEYIEPELQKLMKQLKNENYLSNLSKNELAERLAYYLSELNVLHPYREGNGRTTREFIRELALKNGYVLDLRKVLPQDFLNASIKSIVDTTDLTKLISICLEKK